MHQDAIIKKIVSTDNKSLVADSRAVFGVADLLSAGKLTAGRLMSITNQTALAQTLSVLSNDTDFVQNMALLIDQQFNALTEKIASEMQALGLKCPDFGGCLSMTADGFESLKNGIETLFSNYESGHRFDGLISLKEHLMRKNRVVGALNQMKYLAQARKFTQARLKQSLPTDEPPLSIPTFFEIASIAEHDWFEFQPIEANEKVTGISSRIMGSVKTMKETVSGVVDSNIMFYSDCLTFLFDGPSAFEKVIQGFLRQQPLTIGVRSFFNTNKHQFMRNYRLNDETAASVHYLMSAVLANQEQTHKLIQLIEDIPYQDQVNIMNAKFSKMVGAGQYSTGVSILRKRACIFVLNCQQRRIVGA